MDPDSASVGEGGTDVATWAAQLAELDALTFARDRARQLFITVEGVIVANLVRGPSTAEQHTRPLVDAALDAFLADLPPRWRSPRHLHGGGVPAGSSGARLLAAWGYPQSEVVDGVPGMPDQGIAVVAEAVD